MDHGVVMRFDDPSKPIFDPPDSNELNPERIFKEMSVWDRERTTVPQMATLVAAGYDPFVLIEWHAEKILLISHEGFSLRVLRKPLTGERASEPGATGHCEVDGIGVPAKVEGRKKIMKALRSDLAEIATVLS